LNVISIYLCQCVEAGHKVQTHWFRVLQLE
jgi:hypothetical protein